eukprot:symbB.v1.2.021690.t1/scaffold1889.1/size97066/5
MTVEDSWGLADRGLVADAFEKFQSDVRSLMASCISKYGGPENYMRARFPTAEAQQEWINYLAEIQDMSSSSFHTAVDLPVFRGTGGSAASNVWAARGKVTEESVELFVKTLIEQNRKMPAGMKRKLDKSQWERIAEESACVCQMAIEVLSVMPVSSEALREAWHDRYVDGDAAVVCEVQSAIMQRSALNIRDVATLNQLMTQHASTCPVPKKDLVSMQQLERDSFDLVMRQLNYDLQALKVARAKRSSWESSVYHVKLQHKVQIHESSTVAAKWFMENYVKVITSEKSDEMLRSFHLHRQAVINRLHARDGRPCTYPGRLLFNPTGKDKVWANSQLVKTGRTADAEMPHSRDMLQVEDISEDALPSTVDDDNAVVQGAMKYQQVQSLASGHMAGNIIIPGHSVGSAECPADLLEKEPDLPKLNIMVSRRDLYPEVPGPVIRQWANHELQPELQKLLDQIHEEHGPVPETSTTAPDAVPATANADPPADASGPGTSGPGEGSNRRKRKNENTPASTKRPKDLNLNEDKLCECPMLNKNSNVMIHVKSGNRPYLVNKSEAGQNLAAGTVLAAFGRGRFKRHQANPPAGEVEDPRKEVKYSITGPDDLVLYNGNLTSVYDLVEARRNAGTTPTVKINYYAMMDKPVEGKPGNFEVKQLQDLRFVPAPATVENSGNTETTVNQMNLASLLPVEAWNSHCSKVIYSVKWATAGLTPVRPQVVLTADLELPPGRTVALF